MTNPNSPLLVKLAQLIRDIMVKPESEIFVGRVNMPQNDFETGFITVDQLGSSTRESGGEKFDSVGEIMTYEATFKTVATIDFYGLTAYANADNLTGLLRSQDAADKKNALGITVYHVSSIADVKQLTGQTYGNRLQMSVTVQDSRTVDVATKRIDTVQLEIQTEDGEILT